MSDCQEFDGKKQELEAAIDAWTSERENFKRIQQEWQENKERWQLILQGGNDGIWDWNPRTRTLFLSSRWKEMLGYRDEEIANYFETWKNLLHPDDLDRVLDSLQAYLAREIPEYRLEFRLRCKDNSYKWILARGQALWDETGQPIRMAGTHTDINDRKQREKALEIQADRDNLLSRVTRLLIENDLDTAIERTLDAIGTFSRAARSYIIQYTPCRQQWSMVYEWCDPDRPEIIPILEQSQNLSIETYPWFSEQLLNGIPIRLNSIEELPPTAIAEREILLPSPTPCLLVVPMLDGAGSTVGYLGLDATPGRQWTREDINLARLIGELIAIAQARHRAEIELKEAKEAADRANRAKSEFLANMSHELRTPLNAILGFTRLMARDDHLGREQRDYLGIVNRSGEHLLELINDILEMSKIEAGRTTYNPRTFDLEHLLTNIEEMLQPQARAKGLSSIFDIDADLPRYVYSDESKLRQVLINLLGNGIKFTESGGVTLRVKAIPEKESYRLIFEIEDTGPGITPDDIPKLFEPFVQTETGRKSQQGTGLGLPISRKFVELMGGTLRVSSLLGRGSVFAFDILVTPATGEEIKQDRIARKVIGLNPNQPKYRILVVEDRPESRLLLTTLLSTVGLSTRQAANGREAIDLWREWRPHLIWMDMRMPVMDGYTATREIRRLEGENRRETVIIALTASAFEEDRALVIAAGCDDFVRKPFQEETIWQKMAEYLGVLYIYAEDREDRSIAPSIDPEPLRSSLALMDRDWLDRLREAALECNDDRVIELAAEIPPEQAELSIGLQQLASQFLFDSIARLTENLNIS
ncbi:ATP-binding protein [Pannus brasiliensis CCIBt3594]|uniref:Circadian input-output histidine kinase CikA n=1 Tax=Pannus brasiliensis CCIBt3594 TaxID=1427578 RepID=A0AAW9QY03_9CHRO